MSESRRTRGRREGRTRGEGEKGGREGRTRSVRGRQKRARERREVGQGIYHYVNCTLISEDVF